MGFKFTDVDKIHTNSPVKQLTPVTNYWNLAIWDGQYTSYFWRDFFSMLVRYSNFQITAKMNNQYDTLSEAVELLKKRGFTHNFSVSDQGELIETGEESFEPSHVKLVEFHRFEGTSDPGDMSIVYALETDSGVKGTVVDSFGVDGSESVSNFMDKVEQGQYED